jgi:hypothetical protein
LQGNIPYMKNTILSLLILTGFSAASQCWQSVSAGFQCTSGIKSDNTLWSIGGTPSGDGSSNSLSPNAISIDSWQSLNCGYGYNTAVRNDGTLWAWGSNFYGQFGTGNTNNSDYPIQSGTASDWQAVYPGSASTVGVKADGSLWAWGMNTFGTLGTGNTTSSLLPIEVSTPFTDWEVISHKGLSTAGIRSDGSLWMWGDNTYGQLATGNTAQKLYPYMLGVDTDWMTCSSGHTTTFAIKTDGTLWSWGNNYGGQLGDGTTDNRFYPAQVGGETDWAAVAAGAFHVIALKTNGTLWSWGLNDVYQLGDDTIGSRTFPGQVGNDTDWIAISSSWSHNIALKTDGTAWTFGRNDIGELGTGSLEEVVGLSQVTCEVMGTAQHESLIPVIYTSPDWSQLHIYLPYGTIEKVTVFDISGKKVIERIDHLPIVDIAQLASGVYVASIRSIEGESHHKFVKQ